MSKRFLLSALTLLISLAVGAIDLNDSGSFTMTGFYSLTGAEVVSGSANGAGSTWQYQQFKCPCTIQNWEYIGVYQKSQGLQFDQESLVGAQFKANFTDTFSATAQLVSRPDNTAYRPYTPTVDWAYLSWKPDVDSGWTFQAGRKRIPLYYYSDYLYIGYAYPWVRPAPDVYGWPIYAYDGVNVGYEMQLGDSNWTMTSNLWYGNYSQKKDAYDTLLYANAPTGPMGATVDESWKNIWGGWLNFSNGVFEVRGMLMNYHDNTTQNNPDGTQSTWVSNQSTTIAGLAANVDWQHWVVRAEYDKYRQVNTAQQIQNIYTYYLIGAGYKIGEFTPMVTQSHYTTDPLAGVSIEGRKTDSFLVRWDFYKNTALKFQYDISKDKSTYPYPFFGDSNLVSVSLQGVF